MIMEVLRGIFLFKIVLALAKEAELPLCPTNVLYFPQNLPMHCRMPTNADFPAISGGFPSVTQFNQSPSSYKHSPLSVPISISPGVPGPMPIPGPLSMPGAMPIPGPMPLPGQMPVPGQMPILGSIGPSVPVPFSGPISLSSAPAHKLPVIVMPFYSPDSSFKKTGRPDYPQHSYRLRKRKIRHGRRKPINYSSDTSSSTETEPSSELPSSSSSEYQGWWKGRKNHRKFNGPIRVKKRKRNQKRQLLTPVLQYVTKDGYVIFEKKISKNEAKDWLNVNNHEKVKISTLVSPEARDMESDEQNNDHIAEKDIAIEDNVENVTKRNTYRLNRKKALRDNVNRKRLT